jgi:aminomethyltransferase
VIDVRQDPEAAEQYRAVRTTVGLIDRKDAGLVEVTGRDRAAFLHAMLSNDTKALVPGSGCAAAMLDVHGKVHALVTVLALEDRMLVITAPDGSAALVENLDRYLFAEKVTLRDATGEQDLVLLAGPDAPVLLQRLTGVPVPEQAWRHTLASLGNVDTRIVRGGGETGLPEFWLIAPAHHAWPVRSTLTAAGAREIGAAALEALRMEAGTPAAGIDVDESVLLPEIPFEQRVSYTKGCYLGQEVVVRIRDRGHVNRMLRGLLVDGDHVPSRGATVRAGDLDVGHVTSAAWSFGLARPIALAFVRRQQAEPGTQVMVVDAAHQATAIVSALPFAR